MRTLARRFLFSVPLLIVLGLADAAQAQVRGWGLAVGVGYGPYLGGPGYGPYWAGPGFGPFWGPGWGFVPTHFPGFWGNGLSMYGPPVPTGNPVPGVFGASDSQHWYFASRPVYPHWIVAGYGPVGLPAALPPDVVGPPPVPAPNLDKPAGFEVEVRLPREDARLFIDGVETDSKGAVRQFTTPAHPKAVPLSYDLRAEWTVDGLTTTHTKRVTGRPGEKAVVAFE
jgi:uncharacterized protein (TIGR03000 family)